MKRLVLPLLLVLLFASTDLYAQLRGYPFAPRLRSLRIGVEGGVGVLGSDLTKESQNYHFRPVGNLEFGYVFHRYAAAGMYGGGGTLRSTLDEFESNSDFWQAGILLELRIPALRGSVFPVFQLRGAAVRMRPDQRIGPATYAFPAEWLFSYSGAAGVEIISWRRLGLRALFGVTYTTSDDWDKIVRGDDNDGYSWAALSMQYYFILRR